MKRVLLSGLMFGFLAARASAGMYELDKPTAQQLTQRNAADFLTNQLHLVIDKPGTVGSNIDWRLNSSWDQYGATMQLEVGFVGQLLKGQVITIGKTGDPFGNTYDTFGAMLANDDDDEWAVRLYVKATTGAPGTFAPIAPYTAQFFSLTGWSGTVTEFGFEVDYQGSNVSDNFHVSAAVVPVPGAVLLGILGLVASGLKLRRYA